MRLLSQAKHSRTCRSCRTSCPSQRIPTLIFDCLRAFDRSMAWYLMVIGLEWSGEWGLGNGVCPHVRFCDARPAQAPRPAAVNVPVPMVVLMELAGAPALAPLPPPLAVALPIILLPHPPDAVVLPRHPQQPTVHTRITLNQHNTRVPCRAGVEYLCVCVRACRVNHAQSGDVRSHMHDPSVCASVGFGSFFRHGRRGGRVRLQVQL